jgi:zinc D-Ala-D-Ala dipeptidase
MLLNRFFLWFVLIGCIMILYSCFDNQKEKKQAESKRIVSDSLAIHKPDSGYTSQDLDESNDLAALRLSPTEIRIIEMGLVNVQELDSSIFVDMKYASSDNFLGKDIYDGLVRAYLQPDVAQMLVRAQVFLKEIKPGYSLIVYDAARPRSAQQKLWDAVDAPFDEKVKFLSNPANGSIHNFGAAVDVGIVDKNGKELDMGTEFDHMGELAYTTIEQQLLEDGLLQADHIENRKLLRRVMRHGGFWGIQTEWWHFNACTRDEAREKYQIIE